MKKSILLLAALVMAAVVTVKAQDDDSGLKISGSLDTYFKYDLAGYENNIGTSFANEQNSVSIGMLDIALEQTVGKASFVGEIAFGPRNAGSAGPGASVMEPHIQNLYVSYAFSDVVALSAGYMGTFVGYEVISPAGNFNYSTSYLFTNGPFQNAGIKADFTISDNFAFMVGLFDDWNVYQDFNGVSDFGAQVYVSPLDGWDVYLNFITGYHSQAFYSETAGSVTEFDITTGYQITDAFYVGLNFATASAEFADDSESGFTGIALYPQYAISDAVAVGLRYENFSWDEGESYNAFTLSVPLTSGPLTFIPEFRIDTSDEDVFLDSDFAPTSSASQFVLAAVYAF